MNCILCTSFLNRNGTCAFFVNNSTVVMYCGMNLIELCMQLLIFVEASFHSDQKCFLSNDFMNKCSV